MALAHEAFVTLTLAALVAGFVYGVAHGFAPDHCAALASLLVKDEQGGRRAVGLSLRFGAAHALVLGTLAVPAVLIGGAFPTPWERGAEILGGAVLVLVGVLALRRRPHHHPHGATIVGGVLALGGVRSLAIALPPLLVAGRSPLGAGFYVVAFGIGVTTAMVSFGLLLTEGTRRLGVRRPWITGATGAISVMLGIWWVASNL